MLTFWRTRKDLVVLLAAVTACFLFMGCSSKEPEWAAVNKKVVAEHNIKERYRDDVPETGIETNLTEGKVTPLDQLGKAEIAPGCTANMYWNGGNLVSWMKMAPGAEIAKETLPGDRILVVWEGSVEQLINGQMVEMVSIPADVVDGINGGRARKDIVWLEKGADNAIKAGPEGAYVLEAYWPVRLDYMKKAGFENVPASVTRNDNYDIQPSIKPNVIFDYYDLQFTELVPGANSRIITLPGMQLSFIRMDPMSHFGHHNHPEAQVMITIRGWIDEIVLDGIQRMEKDDSLNLPAFMVHGGTMGPFGCDALDVFWPARMDYEQKRQDAMAAYNHIIPATSDIKLLADGSKEGPGITFGEGPSWLNGKLYFSSMYFDAGWGGSPEKSRLIEMDPDGSYRHIMKGRQTNGTYPLPNGNLAVCNMFGHKVIEVTTKGRFVRTLASEFDGTRIDGPNDICVDAKGGMYFTDPQFIPDERKQPGRSVFYRTPKGKVIRVIEPDEFAMANGIVLSHDGSKLFVNNTYDNEEWWNVDSDKDNSIWVYDVNDDGTLTNGRKFGDLYLTPEVLDRQGRSTSADGMTIDKEGNVYVATMLGVQILNAKGEYVGNINFPVMPVSCCFGGDDMKTLYVVGYDKVYSVKTNMTGFHFPSAN